MTSYTLITGASSGLGLDFAKEYAKQGKNLILIARREERLNELKKELMVYGMDILVYRVDLSKEDELESFLKNLPRDLFVERLINNAGFGNHASFDAQSYDLVSQMIDVNISAINRLIHAFIPAMKAKKQGEILNVASVAAFTPGPYMAQYYATKAYVLSLSIALQAELKPYKIHVSALCPGPTHTEFFKVAKNGPQDFYSGFTMDSLPVVKKGMRDLEANKAISIPGIRNKVLVWLTQITPKTFAAKAISVIQQTKA